MQFLKHTLLTSLAFLTGSLFYLQAQPITLTPISNLPNLVAESSGLIPSLTPGRFWSHNDSGGDPELYCFDTNGALLRTVELIGVPNIDWEELSSDHAGSVYIGDFGNNSNNRQDLTLYRIPHPDLLPSDTITPEAIHFTYADQTAFPPINALLDYDMEAMVVWGDTIFLFSKNRTAPYDGYTHRYWLPAQAGTYVATRIDSFYMGAGPMTNSWVTAAALSPNREHLMLASYPRGWLFSCYEGSNFFEGAAIEFTWPLTQKEGLTWVGNDTLYFTDELLNGILGGKLYRASMTRYTPEPYADLGPDLIHTGNSLTLSSPAPFASTYLWSTGATTDSLLITQSGTYTLTITAPNGCMDTDTIDVQLLVGSTPAQAPWTCQLQHSAGQFYLSTQSPQGGRLEWSLVNVTGTLLAQGSDTLIAGQETRIPLPHHYPAGIYWLKTSMGDQHQTLKFLLP